ncbi:BPSL0067 family protein [Citrobacter amalonaticus]|uniref:BPSL0067 family protein n=1 Tax=Citrobacter amalonaticus TaxID=35703 RepID=UPI00300C85D6
MAYVYSGVRSLEGTAKVGAHHQCVELIQYYAHVRQAVLWKQGEKVLGSNKIAPGTAIATFVKGRYPNHSRGNHAAFYLRQDAGGIWVMDQWNDDVKKRKVSSRYIRKQGGVRDDGTYLRMSNNAEAYYVIE